MGIYFRDRRAHCYPWRVASGSGQGAPGVTDVSGHYHFGIRHFGTYSIRYIVTSGHACPIRNIVTSGHVISGQARFGTAQLHYFKLLCTGSSHGKIVQGPIRLKFWCLCLIYSSACHSHRQGKDFAHNNSGGRQSGHSIYTSPDFHAVLF